MRVKLKTLLSAILVKNISLDSLFKYIYIYLHILDCQIQQIINRVLEQLCTVAVNFKCRTLQKPKHIRLQSRLESSFENERKETCDTSFQCWRCISENENTLFKSRIIIRTAKEHVALLPYKRREFQIRDRLSNIYSRNITQKF